MKFFSCSVACFLLIGSLSSAPARENGTKPAADRPAPAMNPYLSALEGHLSHAIRSGKSSFPGSAGSEAFLAAAAWGYGDPASKHHGEEKLLALLGPAVDTFFMTAAAAAAAREGKPKKEIDLATVLADPPMVSIDLYTPHHGALMAFVEAVRQPKMAAALGKARMAAIRKSLRKHADYWKALEKSPNHEQPWFYAMALANLVQAYRFTGDEAFLSLTGRWLNELARCRGADGALEYMRGEPSFGPVYWYSDATVFELGYARYMAAVEPGAASVVQGIDELARQLTPYYKRALISPGYTEYYSVIWWKHLHRKSTQPFATGALAYMTHDPQIAHMAKEGERRRLFYDNNTYSTRTLFSGIWLREIAGLEAQPFEPYTSFYDANRVGIRGRFGRWNFTAQAGAHAGTVVGATLLDGKRELQSVLQRVTPVIRKNPDPAVVREDLHGLWILSWHTGSSAARPLVGVARAGNFGVVATSYHPLSSHWAEDGALEKRMAQSRDWKVDQIWITTPERLVGFVKTTCLAPNRAAGVALWNSFSEVDSIRKISDTEYDAGGLLYTIHGHSYAAVGTGLSPACVALPAVKIRWQGLYLTDEPGEVHYIRHEKSPVRTYQAGESWRAVVEIAPRKSEENAPMEIKVLSEDEELLALELRGGKEGRLLALFNRSGRVLSTRDLRWIKGLELYRGVSGEGRQQATSQLSLQPGEAVLFRSSASSTHTIPKENHP